MTESMTSLAAALRERLAIIRDEASRRDPEKHIGRLEAVSEKIEALQRAISPTADPRLRHYLERRSYDKALEWIEQGMQPDRPGGSTDQSDTSMR